MFPPVPTRILWGYIISLVLTTSCAQITAPTGGERDATPPEITSEAPPNNSIHFTAKSIEIGFNEFVQVQNAQNIVISPAMDPAPEISARKRTLQIKFKQALEPNTTYSIFFGSNVGDVNENNKLDNYSYVFSTGDYLDSLVLQGDVVAAEGTIPDNTYLLLYKETNDSAFQQQRPFYLSKVDKSGSVKLEHVKAGTYRAYTLSDKNLNYYYDLPNELIGFQDSPVVISSNIDSLKLPLFLPEDPRIRIVEFDKAIRRGLFKFKLNKELSFTSDAITVTTSEDSTLQTAAFQEPDNQHIKVYFTNLPNDSASYTLLINNNGVTIDSLRVRSESRRNEKTITCFTDTTALKNLSVLETQPLKLPGSFYSLSPIDTARIELRDSSGQLIPFIIERDADLRTYFIHAEWKDKMNYLLRFGDSAFYDLAGNYQQEQIIRFSGISRRRAGTLVLRVELPHIRNQAILRVKDPSGKIVRQYLARDSQSVQLDAGLLPAGTYFLEAIDDVNNNGIWNSGNFTTKTLPEKIFKQEKPILIKENWDAEETVIVDYSQKLSPQTVPALKDFPANKPGEKNNPGNLQQSPGKIMKE